MRNLLRGVALSVALSVTAAAAQAADFSYQPDSDMRMGVSIAIPFQQQRFDTDQRSYDLRVNGLSVKQMNDQLNATAGDVAWLATAGWIVLGVGALAVGALVLSEAGDSVDNGGADGDGTEITVIGSGDEAVVNTGNIPM